MLLNVNPVQMLFELYYTKQSKHFTAQHKKHNYHNLFYKHGANLQCSATLSSAVLQHQQVARDTIAVHTALAAQHKFAAHLDQQPLSADHSADLRPCASSPAST